MTTHYYLLHFVPDLATGTRFTIGAVVRSGELLRWVEAPQLPPSDYLSPKLQHILKLALEELPEEPEGGLPRQPFPEDAVNSKPGRWPPRLSNLGNHFHVEAPQPLPAQLGDPLAWLRDSRLPQQPSSPRQREAKAS